MTSILNNQNSKLIEKMMIKMRKNNALYFSIVIFISIITIIGAIISYILKRNKGTKRARYEVKTDAYPG